MKHHCHVVVILLALTNFFKSVKSETYDAVNATEILQAESSLEEQVPNNSGGLATINNLCTLYDQSALINDFVKPNHERLFIIIADDMSDAITLAEFLSDKNRLLPERKFLHNEIKENYYLYYSIETSAHIFVYPTNASNAMLATYLTKKTIEHSENVKIALTCHEDNSRDSLNRMFQVAAEILQQTDFKRKSKIEQSIIFLPLSAKIRCGYLKAVNKLEEYFTDKFSKFEASGNMNALFSKLYSNSRGLNVRETLEYLVIEPILMMKLVFGMDELCEMDQVFTAPMRVLVWNYVETKGKLIKFDYSLLFPETDENFNCFESRISSMGNEVFSDHLNVNMTLTSVFTFFDSIQSSYDKLSSTEYDEKSMENLCNGRENLNIVKLFCHIRYMSSAPNSKIWISLQRFKEEYLRKKLEWFAKLKSLYDDKYLFANNSLDDHKSLDDKYLDDNNSLADNNSLDDKYLDDNNSLADKSLDDKYLDDNNSLADKSLDDKYLDDNNSLADNKSLDDKYLDDNNSLADKSLDDKYLDDNDSLADNKSLDDKYLDANNSVVDNNSLAENKSLINNKSLYDNKASYDNKTLCNNNNLWNEKKILQKFQNLYEEIQEIDHNNKDLMKRVFFTIKNSTVTKQVDFFCFPLKNKFYKLQIKGEILKFSDIFKSNYCPGRVKFIELFALDKIIIDEDLMKVGEEVQFIMIAPIWEVVFERIINLDGASGNMNRNRTETFVNSEADSPGKNDGSPGLPGGPGGVFFGIYEKLIEGKNLRISSNGGNGGDGENGTKGDGPSNPPGDGGVPGTGGIPGTIELLPLKSDSSISEIQLSSKNGADGNYGIGAIFQNNADFLVGRTNHNRVGHQKPNKPILLDNFSDSIKRYRKYLVSSALKCPQNGTLDFYGKLNNNTNILHKYKILDFIEDLTNLEKSYSMDTNKSTLLFFLTAWREGIRNYYFNEKVSDKHSKVLSSLDTIVSRKVQKLADKFYRHSILKIDAYLDECLTDSARLRDAEILSDMKTITRRFKIDFEIEIKKARKLVQEDMQNYLEAKGNELASSVGQIVTEVNTLIEMKANEIERLEEKRIELRNKLILRSIFGCVQFVFLAISFINPVCAVVGSLLRVGAFVLESEMLDSPSEPIPEIKLPKAVINSMERTFQAYDRKSREELSFVEKKLVEMEAKQSELIASGENAQPLIDAGTRIQQLLSLKSTNSPMKRLKNIFQQVGNKWSKTRGVEKSLKFMQNSVEMDPESIVDLGKETYQKISHDLSELKQMDRQIQQAPDDIEKLEDFKEQVFQRLAPKIQQIRDRIRTKSGEFAVSSITYLEFEKWHVDEYLTDVSLELETWTKQFTAEESVRMIMKKLKGAISTIIRLHVLMKDFHLKMKNADHLEGIASAPFQLTNIQDGRVRKPLTKLLQTHYANDILDEYEKWMIAFKQYTFPFVGEFPDVLESPVGVARGFDPVAKANLVVEKMKFFKSHLNKKKAHGQLFKSTSTTQFGRKGPFSAFYTWSHDNKHSSVIRDILGGNEVKLFADISDRKDLSAVKFRKVDISFFSDDPKINDDLRNDLKGFSVSLTHNGDSYYRCGDSVYLIESGAFEFGSKFFVSEKRRRRRRRRRRRFLDEDELDFVLSPFATWTVRLNNISESSDFGVLANYVNNVNIEIVGEGQYVNSNVCVCKTDFTRYYGEKIKL